MAKISTVRLHELGRLGYHNSYTAGKALIFAIEAPAAEIVEAKKLHPSLVALLCELLPEIEATPADDGGGRQGLAQILRSKAVQRGWLAGGLAAALQQDVYPGKTSFGGLPEKPSLSCFYIEYRDAALARLCAETAAGLAHYLCAQPQTAPEQAEVDLRVVVANYRARNLDAALQANTREILAKAEARGIPWYSTADGAPYIQLGQGCKLHRFNGVLNDRDGLLASEIEYNKHLSHRLLAEAGLPTPKAAFLRDEAQAVAAARHIGYPLVLKPNTHGKGVGVIIGLTTEQEVREAFFRTQAHAKGVIMESFIPGDDHRLLVVGGKLIAAARRIPARVLGDGKSSIRELIATANRDPRRRRRNVTVLAHINFDEETQRLLEQAGLTLDSVPPKGAAVLLKRTANISTGGTAEDVTGIIHPDNVALAERAARIIGLDIAGVDFITTDISRSHYEVGGAICELNTRVGLGPHRAANPSHDVVSAILERAFPPGENGRIPFAALCGGGNGAVLRSLARILANSGLCCGVADAEGMTIGGARATLGRLDNYRGAEMLFGNPDCEAALLALSAKNILARGLAFQHCDVAAILGQTEPPRQETRQGLREAWRRLLASAQDAVVLDADDADCMALLETLPDRQGGTRRIVVSEKGLTPQVAKHLRDGGEAVLTEAIENCPCALVHHQGKKRRVLLRGESSLSREQLQAAAIAQALRLPEEALAGAFAQDTGAQKHTAPAVG